MYFYHALPPAISFHVESSLRNIREFAEHNGIFCRVSSIEKDISFTAAGAYTHILLNPYARYETKIEFEYVNLGISVNLFLDPRILEALSHVILSSPTPLARAALNQPLPLDLSRFNRRYQVDYFNIIISNEEHIIPLGLSYQNDSRHWLLRQSTISIPPARATSSPIPSPDNTPAPFLPQTAHGHHQPPPFNPSAPANTMGPISSHTSLAQPTIPPYPSAKPQVPSPHQSFHTPPSSGNHYEKIASHTSIHSLQATPSADPGTPTASGLQQQLQTLTLSGSSLHPTVDNANKYTEPHDSLDQNPTSQPSDSSSDTPLASASSRRMREHWVVASPANNSHEVTVQEKVLAGNLNAKPTEVALVRTRISERILQKYLKDKNKFT